MLGTTLNVSYAPSIVTMATNGIIGLMMNMYTQVANISMHFHSPIKESIKTSTESDLTLNIILLIIIAIFILIVVFYQ